MRNVRPNKLTSVWGIDLPWNFWEHFGPMSRIKKELLSHSSLVVGILQHEQGGRGGNHTPKIYYAACRTLQLREGSVALGGVGLIFRAFFPFVLLYMALQQRKPHLQGSHSLTRDQKASERSAEAQFRHHTWTRKGARVFSFKKPFMYGKWPKVNEIDFILCQKQCSTHTNMLHVSVYD